MLVHHADAECERILGRADRRRLAINDDATLVRTVEPVQDLHQGGLAGAVLAQQRVHFTGTNVEGHGVVGDDVAELFGDADKLDPRDRPGRGGSRQARAALLRQPGFARQQHGGTQDRLFKHGWDPLGTTDFVSMFRAAFWRPMTR